MIAYGRLLRSGVATVILLAAGIPAMADGGGIYYASGCVAEVNDCNFVGNIASIDGGAVLCDYDNSIMVTDCNFAENLATYGGAFYFEPNCSGTIAGSILVSNSADEDGGAIYLTDANNLSVVDCNVSFNTAVRGGALFCLESPKSEIINCLIKHIFPVLNSIVELFYIKMQ